MYACNACYVCIHEEDAVRFDMHSCPCLPPSLLRHALQPPCPGACSIRAKLEPSTSRCIGPPYEANRVVMATVSSRIMSCHVMSCRVVPCRGRPLLVRLEEARHSVDNEGSCRGAVILEETNERTNARTDGRMQERKERQGRLQM